MDMDNVDIMDKQGYRCMFLSDVIVSTGGSIFQRVGADTTKALVPTLVFILGTKVNQNLTVF